MHGLKRFGYGAILLGWAWMSQATAQTVYRVVNVPPGDTLALRASPDHASAKLADVPRDASGLVSQGRSLSIRGARWVLVSVQGRHGWVNARYVARAAAPRTRKAQPQLGPLHATLDCVGEDPFWVLRAGTSDLTLRDAKANLRMWRSKGPIEGRGDGTWRLAGEAHEPLAGGFRGSLQESHECRASGDGPSRLAISFRLGGRPYLGCCTVQTLKPQI